AARAVEEGISPVIVTGDRDLLQLAGEATKIKIARTKAGKAESEDFFAADMIAQFGVTPAEYIDVKALMGDASDNIPGVPGIGEKTALKIVQDFHSVENAIAHADEIKPKKASENLAANSEQAILSKMLATIRTDAPVALDLDACVHSGGYGREAREEVIRLNFKSLLPRFQVSSEPAVKTGARAVRAPDEARELANELCNAKVCAFVTLTEGGAAETGVEPVAISFCRFDESGKAESENVAVLFENALVEEYFQALRPFFESPAEKLTLNSKNERTILYKYGIEPQNITFDAVLAGYVVNALKPPADYSDIARDYLGESPVSVEEFWGKGKNRRPCSQIPAEELAGFAAAQTAALCGAYTVMRAKITENGQDELYRGIELPLAQVLFDMETYGIKVDRPALKSYGAELDGRCLALTREIYALAGQEFNINSPSQLGEILFEKLGLKGGKKNKTGYSTAADVLEKLKDKHPIVQMILDYRAVAKLKSTYVDGFLAILGPGDSKAHSTFNQTVTATGRISSTEPNLQNIPIRTELGRELRKVFVPTDENYVFMDADYSQIELRILAHMSGDEALINAFKEGQDIHRLTASQVLKIPMEEVTPAQRSSAKAVNFGIVYGISAFSLSEDLGISVKEADEYMRGYFERYPAVKAYMDGAIAGAKEKGYARTIFNRRREIPEIFSSNFNIRSFGERVAMNMPIQGSAADIIKIAMVNVWSRLKSENLKSRLILQVHDELLLEVWKGENEAAARILKEEMEGAAALAVPMAVDLHEGETWYEAK
ncbi:MAG: DNA polymerase I, partial [Defluviitaleaceae bacterium]|nr:DNA polymerase I [Defluviitaleaceae bacterium]